MITMAGKTQSQIDTEATIAVQQKIIDDNTAILDATRYHVDIAFENGESVLPGIVSQRAEARAAISSAQAIIKSLKV